MGSEEVEVNGRTLAEGIYLENTIKICEKCFTNINAFRQTFRNLSWFCGLKEDELDRLTQYLDGMKDILLEYYNDMNKMKGNNNG
ncbi:MAG: hypothetical protein ACI4SI_08990 [Candidatus Ornithospirochaeta sp.]